jgi:hypothetical protein
VLTSPPSPNRPCASMTESSYTCPECGESHDGLPTDWAFRLPDEVWALSYLDRYRRTRTNDDLCTLDDRRHFIRGLVQIPFSYVEGEFAWGVWVEVSAAVHDFYVDNYTNEFASGTRAQGRLANAIPGFDASFGLPVDIEFRNSSSRPLFTFPGSARHPLALDQRTGIDDLRHHRYLASCGYFDEGDA